MDLKLNRFLVAGDVRLDGPAVHAAGAAFAGYPDLDRSYFLTNGTTPDAPPERWTYYGLDWSNVHAGREQPGDAFHFPDLTGERPYIYAVGARIAPKTNVLFTFPRVYTAGVYIPLPRYVVTFSANSHFYENGFQGARADVALPFNGSEHSLSALHLRNDAFSGTYTAIDQHFVWDKDWIVASIDPLTQVQRQYNVIGFKTFSPKLQGRIFLQESAGQAGIINKPIINAAAFTEIQLNAGLRRSGLSYTQDNYYQQLLGFRTAPDELTSTAYYDPRWREHPMNALLTWTGYQNSRHQERPASVPPAQRDRLRARRVRRGRLPQRAARTAVAVLPLRRRAAFHEPDQARSGAEPIFADRVVRPAAAMVFAAASRRHRRGARVAFARAVPPAHQLLRRVRRAHGRRLLGRTAAPGVPARYGPASNGLR